MAIGRLSVSVGAKGKARPHAEYISRQGKYAKDEKLEKLSFSGYGNMPEWAKDKPLEFWKASDDFERKNGSTYREHVIALPRELSEEQNHELIKDWIETELGDKHAYQYAIHIPKANDGKEQPHCHLQFCDRVIDSIDRDATQYFKRYNKKHPERGGAKKARTGMKPAERKEELKAVRDRWEKLCNAHLEKANSNQRISMKSYKDRNSRYIPITFTLEQIKQGKRTSENRLSLKENVRVDHRQKLRAWVRARRQVKKIDITAELEKQKANKAEREAPPTTTAPKPQTTMAQSLFNSKPKPTAKPQTTMAQSLFNSKPKPTPEPQSDKIDRIARTPIQKPILDANIDIDKYDINFLKSYQQDWFNNAKAYHDEALEMYGKGTATRQRGIDKPIMGFLERAEVVNGALADYASGRKLDKFDLGQVEKTLQSMEKMTKNITSIMEEKGIDKSVSHTQLQAEARKNEQQLANARVKVDKATERTYSKSAPKPTAPRHTGTGGLKPPKPRGM